MKPLATGLITAAAIWAQGIAIPRAGCYRDKAGAARPLYGVAASFVPGEAFATGVLAMACSETAVLIKTRDAVEWRDAAFKLVGRWPAPEGPAVLAFVGARSALAYFPEANSLLKLELQRPPKAIAAAPGKILAIASRDGLRVRAVIWDENETSIVTWRSDGLVENREPLPGHPSVALLLADGSVVSAEQDRLVLRLQSGVEARVEVSGKILSLEQMGEAWISAAGERRTEFAIRIAGSTMRVYRIPEAER